MMEERKNNSNEGLERFLIAQDGKRGNYTLYKLALKEIQEGKLGFECWIRHVYPQQKRKGTSRPISMVLMDVKRRKHTLNMILRERLIEAAQVLLKTDKPIFEIFSNLGVMKLRTCMLLFASVSDEPVFKQVVNKYRW